MDKQYAAFANRTNFVSDDQLREIEERRTQSQHVRKDREDRKRVAESRRMNRDFSSQALAMTPARTPPRTPPPSPPVVAPALEKKDIEDMIMVNLKKVMQDIMEVQLSSIGERLATMEENTRRAAAAAAAAASAAAASARPSPPPTPKHDANFESMLKTELLARVRDLQIDGGMHEARKDDVQPDDDVGAHEINYWRKRAQKDEQNSMKHVSTVLSFIANIVESIAAGLGTRIRLTGLSEAIDAAVDNGDFDHGLKTLSLTPAAVSVFKNPMASFMSTFATIILQTYLKNLKQPSPPQRPPPAPEQPARSFRTPAPAEPVERSTPPWGSFNNHMSFEPGVSHSSLEHSDPSVIDQFAVIRDQMKNFSPLLQSMTKIASITR